MVLLPKHRSGNVPKWDGPAVLPPCQQAKLARGAKDKEHAMSRHNLVFGGSKDPNHDAVMRISSETPKQRTSSLSALKAKETRRGSATSNRHRRPVGCGRTKGLPEIHR
ncbi:hypothetical protein XH86_12490 [Bradyrhizobium guangdongense]|uniref:Uncharacterized protein n=1 Tax=Bradyrhizobium guangdongense TaxID=1325090 RepID=A0ABX6UDS9_9BRAD|nr:hypothetical protein X265_12495 [Bradyrhizobium guangdongense]QOZ59458.1 hypothetical protein XH86_12490 [Bradyrhizobium guangdongense]